jgi:hypothetical protein
VFESVCEKLHYNFVIFFYLNLLLNLQKILLFTTGYICGDTLFCG